MWLAMGLLVGQAAGGYTAAVLEWRRERETKLRADDGWLTVAGLFWLSEGENRLPAPAPAEAAPFVLRSGKVTYQGRALRADTEVGGPDSVVLGDRTLIVIRRGDRVGVRLKDKNAPARRSFRGLRWYPVRPEMRVVARFTPYDGPHTLAMENVLGQTEQQPSPGFVTFTIAGHELRLDPTTEDGQLFFVFRDHTSGRETYPAGRFLKADLPKNGQVVLDFNQAYSPPCAFTAYATCPLPPKQNRLPVAIEAGERFEHH
jgi:uncharacterized protein (DUF1684 family)